MKKHIVSFSGGKDSTAMLIRMLEEGMQIDEILFADTKYEFREMYAYIRRVELYIQDKFDPSLSIKIIRTKKDFVDTMFGEITRGKSKGEVRGFPLVAFGCWWSRDSKFTILNKYMDGHIRYVGLAHDEMFRVVKGYFEKGIRYPLIHWKMTEADCIDFLQERGLHNPLYNDFDRLGCWWCPKQSLTSLRTLYNKYPKYWNQVVEWDEELTSISPARSFSNRYDLKELGDRFEKEQTTD